MTTDLLKVRHIALDIETGPLPVSAREFLRPTRESVKVGNIKDAAKIEAKIAEAMADFDAGTDAALDALSGQVLMVGIMNMETDEIQHLINNNDETALLLDAWALLSELDPDKIVGHNVVGFDARFMIRRSMILGVDVPARLANDLWGFRPDIWADTLKAWQLGDRQEYVSLANLCGAFGLPSPKGGEITGANFAQHFAAGNLAGCIAYNAADLRATADLARKMGVV